MDFGLCLPNFPAGASPEGIESAADIAAGLGLSAILEEEDGTISYWALAHPPGRPDFHHPDCLALTDVQA